MLEDEDLRKIVQAMRAVLNAEQSVSGHIAERWLGGQLVRYDRRQKRRRQEWKERLPETGTRLVRADRLEIDVGVEKVFQR